MKIGVTIGDPAGIGPEITVKALYELYGQGFLQQHELVVFTGKRDLQTLCPYLEREINELAKNDNFRFIGIDAYLPSFPGKVTAAGGVYAVRSLQKVTEYYKNKIIEALVTAPIDKKSLKAAGIEEADHTAILQRLSKAKQLDTLFKAADLFIYFYTKHIPFKEISASLNTEALKALIKRASIYNESLNIGRNKPLAVAALNPHAGDDGRFGDEEKNILEPVIRACREDGIDVEGPIPADSVFALAGEGKYSAVVSLYHDQGHIAAKTKDFYKTVSMTLGLPYLRSSVDHGSAMDIAGKDLASYASMTEAIKTVVEYGDLYVNMVKNRK